VDWPVAREIVQTAGAVVALIAGGVGLVVLVVRTRGEAHRIQLRVSFQPLAQLVGHEAEPPEGRYEVRVHNLGREVEIVKAYVVWYTPPDLSRNLPRPLLRGRSMRFHASVDDIEDQHSEIASYFGEEDLTDADLINARAVVECGEGHEHTHRVDRASRRRVNEFLKIRTEYHADQRPPE